MALNLYKSGKFVRRKGEVEIRSPVGKKAEVATVIDDTA